MCNAAQFSVPKILFQMQLILYLKSTVRRLTHISASNWVVTIFILFRIGHSRHFERRMSSSNYVRFPLAAQITFHFGGRVYLWPFSRRHYQVPFAAISEARKKKKQCTTIPFGTWRKSRKKKSYSFFPPFKLDKPTLWFCVCWLYAHSTHTHMSESRINKSVIATKETHTQTHTDTDDVYKFMNTMKHSARISWCSICF